MIFAINFLIFKAFDILWYTWLFSGARNTLAAASIPWWLRLFSRAKSSLGDTQYSLVLEALLNRLKHHWCHSVLHDTRGSSWDLRHSLVRLAPSALEALLRSQKALLASPCVPWRSRTCSGAKGTLGIARRSLAPLVLLKSLRHSCHRLIFLGVLSSSQELFNLVGYLLNMFSSYFLSNLATKCKDSENDIYHPEE